MIGIGITAFLVYIVFVMIWYLLLKRSIAEAMLLGLFIVCAFNGVEKLPQTVVTSMKDAVTQDVMAAIVLFTFMSSIMMQTGIIHRLVDILNAVRRTVDACVPPAFDKGLCVKVPYSGSAEGEHHRAWDGSEKGGSSLAMFLGIIIPLIIITGPVGKFLETLASFGEDAVGAMNIIIWVPVMIMAICMIEGRKLLPKTKEGWFKLITSSAKTCCSCGAVSLFAMAGSNALTETGFGDELTAILASLTFPKVIMLLIIGFIIALVAGPLNATSTTVSIGPVAYSAMVAVGVPPVTAVVCYLIFASTEGASPPMSSPIFVSSSIAGVEDVSLMFKPLIFHYCIPIVLVGVLVGLGILPIIGGDVK